MCSVWQCVCVSLCECIPCVHVPGYTLHMCVCAYVCMCAHVHARTHALPSMCENCTSWVLCGGSTQVLTSLVFQRLRLGGSSVAGTIFCSCSGKSTLGGSSSSWLLSGGGWLVVCPSIVQQCYFYSIITLWWSHNGRNKTECSSWGFSLQRTKNKKFMYNM